MHVEIDRPETGDLSVNRFYRCHFWIIIVDGVFAIDGNSVLTSMSRVDDFPVKIGVQCKL